jgi:AraC-like DNA-binding protein
MFGIRNKICVADRNVPGSCSIWPHGAGTRNLAYDLYALFLSVSRDLQSVPCPSLEELSQRLDVERHTLERAVRGATGTNFRDFRSRMRLEQAKNVLRTRPNQTIKEVAFSLGFHSPRAFCRFVKAASGCSPKEVRRQLSK